MNRSPLLPQEEDQDVHAAETATDIVRELYMAAGKLSVHEDVHSGAEQIIERPGLLFGKWFRFMSVADIECAHGTLYFAGIEILRGPFSDGLGRALRAREIRRVVFLPHLRTGDLVVFLDSLRAPAPLTRVAAFMSDRLTKRGVTGIVVNDATWDRRFVGRHRYCTAGARDLSVRKWVTREFGNHFELVVDATSGHVPSPRELAEQHACYFTPLILSLVLPECFLAMPDDELLRRIAEHFQPFAGPEPASAVSAASIQRLRRLMDAVARHPHRASLIEGIRRMIHRYGIPESAYDALDRQSQAQLLAMDELDDITAHVFSDACRDEDLKRWSAAFTRMLRSGYSERPKSVLAALLVHLKRDNRQARRRAHFLLGRAVAAATATAQHDIVAHLADQMAADVVAREWSFEYADLLTGIGRQLVIAGSYRKLAELASSLRRAVDTAPMDSETAVAREVLTSWSEPAFVHLLQRMHCEEVPGDPASAFEALRAIGGREVARQAVTCVTYPKRRVRMSMLRLLAELGDAATEACGELISSPALWQRQGGEAKLGDESWYRVRNGLHVIGRLGNPRALTTIKPHLGDPDRRVRLEIVHTLEQMGGAEALRYLVLLAGDSDVEVRGAAIVALGAIGGEHEVFVLRELLAADHLNAEKIIYAIGNTGTRVGQQFLFSLLEDEAPLVEAGLASRQTRMRETALRALAQKPNDDVVVRIEAYCRAHRRTFRIPFMGDELTDTARVSLLQARQRMHDKHTT